ncbi:MAG: MopE-related protein [Sandaracinus sp.]
MALALWLAPAIAAAQDLIVDNTTMTLGGVHRYDHVIIRNHGTLLVRPFDGTDRINTGNLVLIAPSITVDATSSIDARGAGYSTPRCADGRGPNATAGGRGGCSVYDSGGGGAHFGVGGRGTKDCFVFGDASTCQFPQEFEESCGNSLDATGTACTAQASCWNYDGAPTVAGRAFWHSIYDVEFGASGGDKGCRDNDGFGGQPAVGGAGGGRIVLVALTGGATGSIQIDGTVTAHGRRGCGTGNDSGGGGAGGSIFIVGDQVQVGAMALVTAGGGRGGDTLAAAMSSTERLDCPAGAQSSGTCDDCGGGGGGGIIAVQSRTSTFAYGATFDVAGAPGGVCPICAGEAGGGAGELQLDGAYVGEICDGYDNDFDGTTDEGTDTIACGLGSCRTSLPYCTSGAPTACTPATTDATCFAARDAARPRIAVILDTSGSMLGDLNGRPTFGDGSLEHPGLDQDGDGRPNDSRLYLARTSLDEVISAYPEIDFALARYHQDSGATMSGAGRFCQSAAWLDCAGIPATYDNPTDNTGNVVCTLAQGSGNVTVRAISHGDECIHYSGSCGPPRRGADILSGFGTETRDLVRWLDGRETAFDPSTTPGDFCNHTAGGDCEVRGAGPTPLAGSLQAVEDYVVPIRSTDAQTACRSYSVILVTDGAESCNGDPVAAAGHLFGTYGIETYVIAVSVLPTEEAQLNAIAAAGSGGARPTATFVRAPGDLVPALTSIIEGSLRTERCNGADDDCDGRIDEDFPALGQACHDDLRGVCQSTGTYVCTADLLGTECDLTMPGVAPSTETCNAMDDDCDDAIDEGLSCTGMVCTPTGAEVCNGVDDDCNGLVDETDPAIGMACGMSMGICMPGTMQCVAGMLRCIGGVEPRPEVCNGLDDDCDGVGDDEAPCPVGSACIEGACRIECNPAQEFPCPPDFACSMPTGVTGTYCVPTICATCAANEICVNETCVDPCAGVTCTAPQTCVGGNCVDCHATGCTGGRLCVGGSCITDPCTGVSCTSAEACENGTCSRACGDGDCPSGQRCAANGDCELDPCADVTCGAGMYCDEGTCRASPCRGTTCERGQVCVASMGCIDNPCVTTHCPSGRTCSVDDRGEVLCSIGTRPPPPEEEQRVLAAGGLSCGVAIGARASGLGVLAGLSLLMALALRRRKEAR